MGGDGDFGGSDTEAASDDEDLDGEDGETVNREELIRQSRLQDMPSVFDAVNALRQGVGLSFDISRSSSRHERERNASPSPNRPPPVPVRAHSDNYSERVSRRSPALELRSFSRYSQDATYPSEAHRARDLEGGINVSRVMSFSDARQLRTMSPRRYAGGPGSDASGSDAGGSSISRRKR